MDKKQVKKTTNGPQKNFFLAGSPHTSFLLGNPVFEAPAAFLNGPSTDPSHLEIRRRNRSRFLPSTVESSPRSAHLEDACRWCGRRSRCGVWMFFFFFLRLQEREPEKAWPGLATQSTPMDDSCNLQSLRNVFLPCGQVGRLNAMLSTRVSVAMRHRPQWCVCVCVSAAQ